MAVRVWVGRPLDVERAVEVYRRSNRTRRRGVWPNQAVRLERVRNCFRDPESWFLMADDGAECVGMAAAVPLMADDGKGPPVPGGAFLSLLFIVPERWGEGIGRAVLVAVFDEARRRGTSHIRLWTHEGENERAHRLYRANGFRRTGRTSADDEGVEIGEWERSLRAARGRAQGGR